MAVDATRLAYEMARGDGVTGPVEPMLGQLNRYIEVAGAVVEVEAPGAPEAVKDEATIRFAAALFDAPPAAPGAGFANIWRSSGAAALVQRWRVLRAISGEAT